MNILLVGNSVSPPYDGGNIHLYNFIKFMGKNTDINLYLIYYVKYGDSRDHGEILNKLQIREYYEVKSIIPYSNYFRLTGLFGKYPYARYIEKAVGDILLDSVSYFLQKYKINVLHLWNVGFAKILKDVKVPKVLTVGDAFSLMHATLERSSGFPRNIYHKILKLQFERYEKEIYPFYDKIIFFSERDLKYANMKSYTKAEVIPVGVDLNIFNPYGRNKNVSKDIIIFHGSFYGTLSNRESAEFIIKYIYPFLTKKIGKDKFEIWIIGRGSRKLFNLYENDSLKIIDYVPDIAEILKKATIYIAPIFSGSGIKNKVLEAMATGLPVVGTKEAFEAIKIDNNEHGIIAENREDFLNALIELLPDSTRKEKIGKNAYALIKQKFSWDTIISKYLKLYNAICG